MRTARPENVYAPDDGPDQRLRFGPSSRPRACAICSGVPLNVRFRIVRRRNFTGTMTRRFHLCSRSFAHTPSFPTTVSMWPQWVPCDKSRSPGRPISTGHRPVAPTFRSAIADITTVSGECDSNLAACTYVGRLRHFRLLLSDLRLARARISITHPLPYMICLRMVPTLHVLLRHRLD